MAETAEALGKRGRVAGVAMDVTDEASAAAALAKSEAELGAPAILVNNAGVAGEVATTWDYTVEEWRRVGE